MPANYTHNDLLDLNDYLRGASNSFFWQCTTRTVQESKLFPVNPYISMSYLNAWYRWPELLRKIDAAMPAEELGLRARNDGSYANTITLGLIPQFYLGGRQILLDMGMLKPTDALDDVALSWTSASASTAPTTARTRTPCRATPATGPRSSRSVRRRSSRGTPSASRPATGCTRRSTSSWPPPRRTAS
jgi:hypothetical protein